MFAILIVVILYSIHIHTNTTVQFSIVLIQFIKTYQVECVLKDVAGPSSKSQHSLRACTKMAAPTLQSFISGRQFGAPGPSGVFPLRLREAHSGAQGWLAVQEARGLFQKFLPQRRAKLELPALFHHGRRATRAAGSQARARRRLRSAWEATSAPHRRLQARLLLTGSSSLTGGRAAASQSGSAQPWGGPEQLGVGAGCGG